MAAEFERTCWRGLQVEHPAEWELALASVGDERPHCAFSDRHYHRLDLRWRALKYKPNLDLVLDKARRRSEKQADTVVRDLAGAPKEWRGVVRVTPDGTLTHASRFFRETRWLVDAVIVWPERRDRSLERRILASVSAADPKAPVQPWQALGISLDLDSAFDLVRSDTKVGRVRWEFATEEKRPRELTVERLALPDYWLHGPLRDWLVEQMPEGFRKERQEPAGVNGHRGEKLISHARVSILKALRGYRRRRTEIAWRCPKEDRVYHVSIAHLTRELELELPERLKVRCCRDAPVVGRGGEQR
jgi:hypothetical protein